MIKFGKGIGVALLSMVVVGCADRLEPPTPVRYVDTDKLAQWSKTHALPYGIPERALRAYAFAAWKVNQEKCELGWPTLAALGAVLSNHGMTHGADIAEDGISTHALRNLDLVKMEPVADTDHGRIDGFLEHDVPVGPLQIMPSKWEQFEASAVPGRKPDPDSIDDASLAVARQLCAMGDLKSSDGWDSAIKSVFADPEFVKQVHAKASEYSR